MPRAAVTAGPAVLSRTWSTTRTIESVACFGQSALGSGAVGATGTARSGVEGPAVPGVAMAGIVPPAPSPLAPSPRRDVSGLPRGLDRDGGAGRRIHRVDADRAVGGRVRHLVDGEAVDEDRTTVEGRGPDRQQLAELDVDGVEVGGAGD